MAVLPLVADTSTHMCPFVLNSISGKLFEQFALGTTNPITWLTSSMWNFPSVHDAGVLKPPRFTQTGWSLAGGLRGLLCLSLQGVQACRGHTSRGAHLQDGLTSRGVHLQGGGSPPGWAHLRGGSLPGGSPPGGLTSNPLPLGRALPCLPALRGISVRAAHLPVRL